MIDIKILGLGTSKHEFLKALIKKELDNHKVAYNIKDVTGIDEIIDYQIESIPSVVVNDDKVFQANQYSNIWTLGDAVRSHILQEKDITDARIIIVPTDFSPTAVNAYHFAQQIASHLDCQIKLVHVYRGAVDKIKTMVPGFDERTNRRNQLEKFERDHRDSSLSDSTEITSEFTEGFAAEEIIGISSNPTSSLIIMGATGENGFLEKIFGSVSIQVSLRSHCPVLLIPHLATFGPFKNILYATNDHSMQANAIKLTVKLGAAFDSKIQFLHIEDEDENYPSWKLSEFLNRMDVRIPSSHHQVKAHSVKEGIDKFVTDHSVDLIVMATRKRNFWESLLTKSVTKELVRQPEMPMLVFHDDDPEP